MFFGICSKHFLCPTFSFFCSYATAESQKVPCPRCSAEFSTKSTMLTHVKSVHEGTLPCSMTPTQRAADGYYKMQCRVSIPNALYNLGARTCKRSHGATLFTKASKAIFVLPLSEQECNLLCACVLGVQYLFRDGPIRAGGVVLIVCVASLGFLLVGRKSFSCPTCKAAFAQKSKLKRHQQAKHSGECRLQYHMLPLHLFDKPKL